MSYRVKFIDFDSRRDPKTNHYCVRCQKDLKPNQKFALIHEVDGGGYSLHVDDEDVYDNMAGDLGFQPVGINCAKQIGMEYVHLDVDWYKSLMEKYSI